MCFQIRTKKAAAAAVSRSTSRPPGIFMEATLNDTRPDIVPCWSCGGPIDGSAFCDTCKAVQPPGQRDHFSRLGLNVSFDIDPATLDEVYFSMQRKLHPDRFATHSPKEKAYSQQQATAINDAYETLKDPHGRADYMVHLKGTDVLPEGCNLINDQVLLIESRVDLNTELKKDKELLSYVQKTLG